MPENFDLDAELDETLDTPSEDNSEMTESEETPEVVEDVVEDVTVPSGDDVNISDNLLNGVIQPHGIEKEITQSYIDYAMSVIVSRALPDTRDGLKPVLRRILFSMYNNKILSSTRYRKSATVVGDVLGKYHPHGDLSVYEAMVRMAQEFSLRYPLIDGQGNFGSIDGDGAAAMRYTEARLTKVAEEMLKDIEQDTVSRRDNFDGSLQEPVMLPTKFPNHLCNGTMGIAVGMATNMPPHNLREVIDASLLVLNNAEATVDDIMDIIKGPDFPTGGTIYDSANIREVYRKGKGGIVTRGKTHIEQSKQGPMIVIDEIPYQVNKSTLVAKIAELVIDKRIEGVTDIRDESSRKQMRIVISLKKEMEDPNTVLYQIYKSTDLQSNFNINNVSLIDNAKQPRLLNIKDLITEFVVFRREVVTKRSIYQLNKAQERLHILEGLKKAIDIIDEVIYTIRHSDTKQDAKDSLMTKFEFSDAQAEYILQMRLQSLVGLEIQRIIDEIEEKRKQIAELQEILNNPLRLDQVVTEEMLYIKDKFGDDRKTNLSEDTSVYNLGKSLKGLAEEADRIKEDTIVRIGDDFDMRILYQSRIQNIPEDTFDLVYTHNQDKLVVITDKGELVVQRLKDLGEHPMRNAPLNLKKHFGLKGKIVFAKTLHVDYQYLMFLTNENSCKKIDKELLLSFKKFPTVVMGLGEKEKILSVVPVSDGDYISVVTERGWMLVFDAGELRPMGKTAGGVKAIELQDNDKVADMFLYQKEPFILVHSEMDGKLLNMEDIKIRKRARRGQEVAELTTKQKLTGGMSIEEGAVRFRLADGTRITKHSNDIYLDNPESGLDKLVDKVIEMTYRPWEEKEENTRYKEEKKKEKKEQTALFTPEETSDDDSDDAEDQD